MMQTSPSRELFESGRRAYNIERYEDAIVLFEQFYRQTGDPIGLYNRGQALRMLGRKTEAVQSYKAYLREQPNSKIRLSVENKVRELERELAENNTKVTTKLTVNDIVDPMPEVKLRTSAPPAATTLDNPAAPNREISKRSYVLAGTTSALLVGAIVASVLTDGHYDKLHNGCALKDTGCSEQEIDGLKHRVWLTNSLIGATATSALATSVSFYLDFKF